MKNRYSYSEKKAKETIGEDIIFCKLKKELEENFYINLDNVDIFSAKNDVFTFIDEILAMPSQKIINFENRNNRSKNQYKNNINSEKSYLFFLSEKNEYYNGFDEKGYINSFNNEEDKNTKKNKEYYNKVLIAIEKEHVNINKLSYEEFLKVLFAKEYLKPNGLSKYNFPKVKNVFFEELIAKYLSKFEGKNIKFKGGYIYNNIKVSVVDDTNNFHELFLQNKVDIVGKTIFYRGQSNGIHNPLASLFREKNQIENEDKRYKEIVMKKYDVFRDKKSSFDKLTTMQHFGLSTRLLDLTTNPLVALYFACCKDDEKDGAIFLFEEETARIRYPDSDAVSIISTIPLLDKPKKDKLMNSIRVKMQNLKELGFEGYKKDFCFPEKEYKEPYLEKLTHEIKKEKPAFTNDINFLHVISDVIVYANFENERVKNQNGLFVACGLMDNEHLVTREQEDKIFKSYSEEDKRLYELNKPKKLDKMVKRKIIIKNETKENFLDILNVFGINSAFVYPEIDSVSKYVNDKDYSAK